MERQRILRELADKVYEVGGKKFHLPSLGWTFGFSKTKRLGVCKGRKKRIEISTMYSDKHMTDTILHEIAHAIDYEIRGTSDHSEIWKSIAVQVGAKPERTTSEYKADLSQFKYIGTCPTCGFQVGYKRKKRRASSCGKCSNSYNPKHKIQIVQQW